MSKVVPGLAVDIDETLSHTARYWFIEMLRLFGNPENLTPLEVEEKYKFSYHVPYWQTPEVKQWVTDRRHDNELQVLLPLIENSNHFVNKIQQIVPIRAYLSMRPDTIKDGTNRWLKKHDFPEAELIFCPGHLHKPEERLAWKAHKLTNSYPEICGIIDDNHEFIPLLPNDYKGTIFLYNSNTNPRPELDIVPCPTWESVYAAVKKHFTDPIAQKV